MEGVQRQSLRAGEFAQQHMTSSLLHPSISCDHLSTFNKLWACENAAHNAPTCQFFSYSAGQTLKISCSSYIGTEPSSSGQSLTSLLKCSLQNGIISLSAGKGITSFPPPFRWRMDPFSASPNIWVSMPLPLQSSISLQSTKP